MRVLLLSNLYPPHVQGGAELAAQDITNGLQMCGHDVMVLTSWWGLPAAAQDGNVSRTLHYSPASRFNRQLPPSQQLSHLRDYHRHYHCSANQQELQRVLTTFKPDILYIWEVTGLGVCSLLRLLPRLPIPVVFQLESYWYQYALSPQTAFSRLKQRWLKRLLIGHVPHLHYTSLIATSNVVKTQYARAGCDPTRIEVIYNCVHPSFLQTPLSSRTRTIAGEVQLLYAGRLCAEKGILVMLKALDLLINRQGRDNIRLHLCGDGDASFLQELHATLAQHRLTHAVNFHGKVLQDEMRSYYDCAAMLLVPSLWQEPFGLVVVEAMACGLPVIASRVGGPAEILSHNTNGLLITPGDEHALAAAITSLAEQPELCKRLGDLARTTVHEHFAQDMIVRKIERHLLKSISDGIKEIG